jgi:hypothetical protein
VGLDLYQWIALLVVIVGLSSKQVIELFRNLGGRGPGGPQHPLPVQVSRPDSDRQTDGMGNFYTEK